MAKENLVETGMFNDVLQQPECWERLLAQDLSEWQNAVRSTRSGLLIGMGSSHYAALAAQFALAATGAIWTPATSDQALHYLPAHLPYDKIVAISQSGASADTVAATERFVDGARLLAVTNTAGSRLTQLAGTSVLLDCGEEKGSSTKTYTTTVLALLLGAGLDTEILSKLPALAQQIQANLQAAPPPDLLSGDRRHYFLGTGANVATALEAALICKEKLFLHTEGDGTADFVHGPLEALDASCTVWIFSTANRLDDLLINFARRVAQTGAKIVVIGEGVERYEQAGVALEWSYSIELDGPDELGTLLFILPMQLLVLWETDRRGYPVDYFRRMDKVMSGYDYGLEGS